MTYSKTSAFCQCSALAACASLMSRARVIVASAQIPDLGCAHTVWFGTTPALSPPKPAYRYVQPAPTGEIGNQPTTASRLDLLHAAAFQWNATNRANWAAMSIAATFALSSSHRNRHDCSSHSVHPHHERVGAAPAAMIGSGTGRDSSSITGFLAGSLLFAPLRGFCSRSSQSRDMASAGGVQPSASTSKVASEWNVPNALSVGRGLSGPLIAYWVLQDEWAIAIPVLIISGATDWLDGYMARRLGQSSVVGSYLDPLGDKVLVGSVICALAYKGMVPTWVAAVVLGRDVALVGGMFLHRFRMVGWRWPGTAEFFHTDSIIPAPQPAQPLASASAKEQVKAGTAAGQLQHVDGCVEVHSVLDASASSSSSDSASTAATTSAPGIPSGVPFMRPLMISKINTVLQLLLVGGCMTQAFYSWPGVLVMHPLEIITAGTTLLSCAAYLQQYMSGRLLGAGAKGPS